jgi:hypothetical protein
VFCALACFNIAGFLKCAFKETFRLAEMFPMRSVYAKQNVSLKKQ